MANKIPIDDLFRNALSHGEEPMNEGAWTNMARMLDGENPYIDEGKRKRRIAPGWWGLGLVALFGTIALVWSQSDKLAKNSSSNSNQPIEASSPIAQHHGDTPVATAANSMQEEATPVDGNSSSITESSKALEASSNSNTSVSSNKEAIPRKERKQAILSSNNTATSPTTNNAVLETSGNFNSTSSAPKTNEASTNRIASTGNSNAKPNKIKRNEGKPLNNGPRNEGENPVFGNKADATLAVSNSNIGNTQAEHIPNEDRVLKKITQVELAEKVQRDRAGNPINPKFDTLAISAREETTTTRVNREPQADAFGKYHPRYVPMNASDDAKAGFKQELTAHVATPLTNSAPKMAQKDPIHSKSNETSVNSNKSNTANEAKHKTSKETTVERLRLKANILGSDFAAKSGKSCPGMSMGVHAAIKNPENNFGGFQFGLNNLKPFGDYFSLLTEIKFFIRNNSGYTIRDIMTTNKNLSMDTMSAPAYTIYNYQIDSSSSLYNFKHFYGMELPILMQFHYRRLSAYAGLNLAYQFRLQTSTVQRNYVLNRADTVSSPAPFYLPAEQGRDVTKDDFKARWGLGFVGGVSYSFTPQLYVDMRLVQNLSDNAQTLSARSVSANTFKVPTIQLSLGYRFRKFVPAQ
ncbi:MAG: outer membrane beta-barrel protein [Chitinophagaceae bacterium]